MEYNIINNSKEGEGPKQEDEDMFNGLNNSVVNTTNLADPKSNTTLNNVHLSNLNKEIHDIFKVKDQISNNHNLTRAPQHEIRRPNERGLNSFREDNPNMAAFTRVHDSS